MRTTIGFVIATLLAGTAATAQDKPADKAAATAKAAKTHQDELIADAEEAWVRPPVDEQASVSKGSVTVGGQRIAYTATAGTLTIRDNDGKPTASVFYTAYTRDGAAPSQRPVTFFYNGGPGSATVWLHMGSFGPMRVTTGNPEYVRPAPYGFASNPYSMLDMTDLVFVDAIGAGWSRPLGAKTGKDFWGVDQDADAFARAVERYVSRNARWSSPKFLFGESYGTLRNGAVAAILEERGLSLNGIVYLSSIMNYGVRQPGYDANYLTLSPAMRRPPGITTASRTGRPIWRASSSKCAPSPAGPMPRRWPRVRPSRLKKRARSPSRCRPISASARTISCAPISAWISAISRPSCCATAAFRSAASIRATR